MEHPLIKPPVKLTAVLILILALAGCSKSSGGDDTAAAPVPDVTIAKVERATIADSLIVSGNLGALQRCGKVASARHGTGSALPPARDQASSRRSR